jgi:hypothetical protein
VIGCINICLQLSESLANNSVNMYGNENCFGQSLYRHVKFTCHIHCVVPLYVKFYDFFNKFMLYDCVSHTYLNVSILSCTVCVKTKRQQINFDVYLEAT